MFPLQINWGKFTGWRFWFRTPALPFFKSTLYFIIFFFVGLIVVAVIFKLASMMDKNIYRRRVWRKLWHCFLTMGIIGEVITFFTVSRAPYLSMRFWYVALLIAFLVWLFFIIKFALQQKSKQDEKTSEKDEYEKYLPK